MKNFFAIDLGAVGLAVCHTQIPQPVGQTINEAFCLNMLDFSSYDSTDVKQSVESFPYIPSGLKSFLGTEDYVRTRKGAFKADAIIVPFLRNAADSLVKDCLGGKSFEEISSAEDSITVIGYPFGWNELQKKAYLRVVEQAGFPNVIAVDEPSALISYFEHFHRDASPEQKGTLIYDLGNSSLNIAIAENSAEGEVKRLATAGNPSLGGCSFDRCIESLVFEKLDALIKEKDLKCSCPKEDEVYIISEKLKERLSVEVEKGGTEVTEYFHLEGHDLQVSLTRTEFEARTEELFSDLTEPVWEALSKAFLQPEDIGTIFFVGSAARLWCVQEGIGSFFPNAKIVWSESPQETMVKGLALHAIAKDRTNKHLVMDTEKQKKGGVLQEKADEKLRPVRSPFRKRILVGAASFVVLFFALGWFFSDHFDTANLFYRSEVQEQKDDLSSGEPTVQDEKRVSDGTLETPENISKEVLLPHISTPEELQIICVLNGAADDSDFYQGVLFAKKLLSVASVKVLQRNDPDVSRLYESFAYSVVVGSKENLDALPKDEHDGVFLFPLSEGASDKNVPEIGVRDVMKTYNVELILFWGLGKTNSKMGIVNPQSSEGVISPVAEKQISKEKNGDLLGRKSTLEDMIDQAKNLLSAIEEPYENAYAKYDNPIYELVESGELKVVLLDIPPQKANMLPDNSKIHMIIPPFEWHRGFWSVVLLLQQERLEGEKTVENLSSFINSTRTIVTRNAVVLYKRHEDTQELQEMQRFPIIGWR